MCCSSEQNDVGIFLHDSLRIDADLSADVLLEWRPAGWHLKADRFCSWHPTC